MQWILQLNQTINGIVWGPPMLILLIGTGIYLTCRTGGLQFIRLGYILRHTVGTLFRKGEKRDHGKNISPFQAVTTALAGTVGTGSIAGVTGAIFAGGPGALFWMWVSALFGAATKYAEITLSLHFRQVDGNGANCGGPMYYIERGLHLKWLACAFAVLGGFACFGAGNIAQATEIAGAMNYLFGCPALVTGGLLTVIVAVVVLGGIQRIGRVTSYLVPVMALFYIAGGILVLVLNFSAGPAAFGAIFSGAFSLRSAGGGVLGYAIFEAMRQGFARGVFSNEAGLGTAPMAHAASSTREPVEQGLWGVFEVFVVTILICTITGLTIVMSGIYTQDAAAFGSNGAAAATAFNSLLPGSLGGVVVEVGLLLFALSTMLGWNYYGERCWGYLTGNNRAVLLGFRIVYAVVCFFGATGSGSLMWTISDTLNGMMAIPNLVGILLLSGTVVRLTRDYFARADRLAGR